MSKKLIFYTLPSVVGGIISFALIPLYTIYLDPIHYGYLASFMLVIGLLNSFSDFGSGWVISSSYHDPGENNFGQKLFIVTTLNFLLKIFLCIIMYLLYTFSFEDLIVRLDLVLSLKIILIGFFFSILASVSTSYIIISGRYKYFAIQSLVSLFISQSISILFLLSTELRTEVLCLQYSTQMFCLFIFNVFLIVPVLNISFDKIKWYSVLKEGYPMLIKNPVTYINTSLDKFMIQNFATVTFFGLYTHGYRYKNYMDTIFAAFGRSFLPHVVKLYQENKLEKHNKEKWRIWLYFNFLISITVILFSGNIIDVLTHSKFTNCYPFVCIFFLQTYLYCFHYIYHPLLVANKKTLQITLFATISTIILITSSLSLYHLFGVTAIPYGLLIGSITSVFMTTYYVVFKSYLRLLFLKTHIILFIILLSVYCIRLQFNHVISF